MIPNPIVRGFAPDPSACRVGAHYFLATSTLEWWPGIPIRHSTDLVHWDLIGHAVSRPAQYRRDGKPGAMRLYAPTLRHHDGRFHLACTNVADGQGNFLLSADDPAGPWSDAVWVDRDAFDPSLTFDGETTYYTRRTVIPGRQGSGPVVQAELDARTGQLLTPAEPITPGPAGFRSNDIEGPHLYRIGDWWYLLAAEGGTWKGHMVTVARARSPWGPFTGYDENPVLTHRNRVGHEIQSVGHAELLDDTDGNWWALFLGTRHDGPAPWHHLGRETFLAPVTWRDDWPVIGDRGTVEQTMPHDAPLPSRGPAWPHPPSAWTAGWTTWGPPVEGVTIDASGGPAQSAHIRLPRHDSGGPGSPRPAVFVRQTEFVCRFDAVLHDAPVEPAGAGITAFITPDFRYEVSVARAAGSTRVRFLRQVGDLHTTADFALPGEGPVWLRIDADATNYRFWVARGTAFSTEPNDPAIPAGAWIEVGSGLTHLLSAETSLTYYGVSLGVFAHGCAAAFDAAYAANAAPSHDRAATAPRSRT